MGNRYGPNELLLNDGSGKFSSVDAFVGSSEAYTVAAILGDVNGGTSNLDATTD